jgi:polyisoprenyl-teichoic acid--peptidoglycan teichoic acid transferase
MAAGDKPYRVYRGGRTKGRVPTLPGPERPRRRDGRIPGRAPVPAPPSAPRRRLGRGRRIGLVLLGLALLLLVWGVLSFLAFRSGAKDANARLEPEAKAALSQSDGLLLTTASTTLLLGTDFAPNVADRQGARRSDSIVLMRTDPSRGRIALLSIPRDLQVPIPGHGESKINAASQLGGTALAIQTVKAFTGLPVDHVAVVDFPRFEELIDTLGGVTIDVPEPIQSKPFDCPYSAERCAEWEGWRFAKGKQEMDGRRALIYSRVRVNSLNPGDSDVTRGARQQDVLSAIARKALSPTTAIRYPLIGDDMLRPLATDLSTWQLTQLGWVVWRADDSRTLRCRLGGEDVGGSVLVPDEDNRNVIAMFVGASAPQPPRPGSLFAPGCITR